MKYIIIYYIAFINIKANAFAISLTIFISEVIKSSILKFMSMLKICDI